MIKESISFTSSFVSQTQLLLPILNCSLSGDSNKKIALSKSLSAQKSFIVPIEKADAECITLEDFLVMLDVRINAEFAYQEEIIRLRDNLCEVFNKLCNGTSDENKLKFVKNQRQRIINTLIYETRIEDKAIAEKFYYYLMNKPQKTMVGLQQLTDIAYTLFWKPLLTPFPIGALDKLKKFVEELGNEGSDTKIESMTTAIVEYIKNHMKEKDIKDSDFKSNQELKGVFEQILKERKTCNIEIKNVTKNESSIKEFSGKCIEKVTLVTSAEDFLKFKSKLNYDEIKINGEIEWVNIERVFNNVQKTVKTLDVRIGKNGSYTQMGKSLSKLKFLKCLSLNLSNNYIGDNGSKVISAGLSELKSISTLNLNLSQSYFGKEGAKAISAALKELKNISTLSLNFTGNNIQDGGAEAVSAALEGLKKIYILNLYFGSNGIGNLGSKAISAALGGLKNILTLDLKLWDNNLGDEGVAAVSAALSELKNISTLTLNLQHNNIGDGGAKAVSAILKKLKNISTLTLNLKFEHPHSYD